MEPESGKEILGLIKQTPQILTMIYSDAAQPSVKKLGQALETVFEFSSSFLLPIKLLNEKFKINFEKRLEDYRKKIEEIPDDKLCDVNPQIGTPIIEKLSYTTNDEIADLFTTLLSKASNIDTVNQAHPSFVQIIERLSVDEARIVLFLKDQEFIPYVSFRAHLKDNKGYNSIREKVTLITSQLSLEFPNNIDVYMENLCSLGLLIDMDGTYKTDEEIYKPIIESYNFDQLNEMYKSVGYDQVKTNKSYYQISNLGKLFITAVKK